MKLVFYSSTITMMHGPKNVRFIICTLSDSMNCYSNNFNRIVTQAHLHQQKSQQGYKLFPNPFAVCRH